MSEKTKTNRITSTGDGFERKSKNNTLSNKIGIAAHTVNNANVASSYAKTSPLQKDKSFKMYQTTVKVGSGHSGADNLDRLSNKGVVKSGHGLYSYTEGRTK